MRLYSRIEREKLTTFGSVQKSMHYENILPHISRRNIYYHSSSTPKRRLSITWFRSMPVCYLDREKDYKVSAAVLSSFVLLLAYSSSRCALSEDTSSRSSSLQHSSSSQPNSGLTHKVRAAFFLILRKKIKEKHQATLGKQLSRKKNANDCFTRISFMPFG